VLLTHISHAYDLKAASLLNCRPAAWVLKLQHMQFSDAALATKSPSPLCSPCMTAGHLSLVHISHAYDLNNIILMSSKLPQIFQNFSARSTGQLSVITYAANTLGCVARLFTTAQEGGGAAMFRQYVISE
jgi:hypothetical protein